ncbi:conserved protein of unknown function [Kyrpidia spormannii]|uniref:Uncharacterized protein n=1 Tax=Kyrpidia spormannii TaxID=2055160 RepID=A0ACA8ZCH9_9BACL|nr:conserved protein of unknown function [Kyrpidia spormannii]
MLAVLLWIFSVYGFISAVWHIFGLLSYRRPVFPPTDVTLVVRNAESFIEGLLRRIAAEVAVAVPGLRVVVVDDGSVDDTMAIVERLAERETWLEAYPVTAGRAQGVGAVLPGVTGGSAGWGQPSVCPFRRGPEVRPRRPGGGSGLICGVEPAWRRSCQPSGRCMGLGPSPGRAGLRRRGRGSGNGTCFEILQRVGKVGREFCCASAHKPPGSEETTKYPTAKGGRADGAWPKAEYPRSSSGRPSP